MEIILRKDIETVGKTGEVLSVKDGYARNFLIPRGLAYKATSSALKIVEREKQTKVLLKERKKREAQKFAETLKTTSCTVRVQAKGDDIFGSVGASEIAASYEAEGIKIDKKNIELASNIKRLGVYQIPIKLHPEVTVNVKVWIVKE